MTTATTTKAVNPSLRTRSDKDAFAFLAKHLGCVALQSFDTYAGVTQWEKESPYLVFRSFADALLWITTGNPYVDQSNPDEYANLFKHYTIYFGGSFSFTFVPELGDDFELTGKVGGRLSGADTEIQHASGGTWCDYEDFRDFEGEDLARVLKAVANKENAAKVVWAI